jgi:hypothetical protein
MFCEEYTYLGGEEGDKLLGGDEQLKVKWIA